MQAAQTDTSHVSQTLLSQIHWDFTAVILLLCSIICVATVIERGIRYRSLDIDAGPFMDRIRGLLRAGQIKEALGLTENTSGPVAAIVRAGILCRDRSVEEIKDTIERVRIRQNADLDRNLPILGTLGATAPFIGLFGTVLGIMSAFRSIGGGASASSTSVATGISSSLQATAGGLLVAILAVVAYNFFVNWSSRIGVEMDTAGNELVHLLTSEQNAPTL